VGGIHQRIGRDLKRYSVPNCTQSDIFQSKQYIGAFDECMLILLDIDKLIARRRNGAD
jgi:hypothetical protein